MADKNNIESFFKNRLGLHDFSYHEADWLILEKKLDAAGILPSQSFVKATPYKIIIILLTAFSAAFLLGWFAHDRLNSTHDATDLQINKNESFPVIDTSSTVNNVDKELKRNGESLSLEKQNSEQEPSLIINAAVTAERQSQSKTQTPGMGVKNSGPGIMLSVPERISRKEQTFSNQFQTNNRKIGNDVDPPYQLAHLDINSFLIPTETDKLRPEQERSTLQYSLATNNIGQETGSGSKDFNSQLKRWAIGFSIAPDYTGVGFDEEKTIALRVGGQLYFKILPRLSISSGVNYSDKKYITNADYYEPPNGYWQKRTNGVIPEQIDGSCKVVDIDLNLNYTVLQLANIDITTSAGISNYLLLDEVYSFEFIQKNPGAASGWKTEENSFAPLSNLNFAIGLELFPKKRVNTAIEAFYNVPIKQVGWGNVKLHSLGTQLTIKYNL